MAKFKDLSGQRFEKWLVISYFGKNSRNMSLFKCQCDCGSTKNIVGAELTRGHTKSCGCWGREQSFIIQYQSLVGKRFGRLIVLKFMGKGSNGHLYECKCDCGVILTVLSNNLRGKTTNSCGCLQLDKITIHGKTGTKVFNAWRAMKYRCLNPNDTSYQDYGGRGIKVCDKWLESFENFYKDMGDPPEGMSLDRIDVNGNYEPSNCRWADKKVQSNNTRSVPHSKDIKEHKKWKQRIQCSLVQIVIGRARTSKYEKYLGCSVEEFLKYLNVKFEDWMNWFNYGKASLKKQTWNLGHVRAANTFDLSKEQDRLVCFNYTNLRPIDARKNAQQARAYMYMEEVQ